GGDVRVERPVVGLEGEAGRAVVVGVRGVAVRPGVDVGDRHHPVRVRRAHQAVGQRRAVDVGGHQGAGGRGGLGRGQGAVLGHRRGVCPGGGDSCRRGGSGVGGGGGGGGGAGRAGGRRRA